MNLLQIERVVSAWVQAAHDHSLEGPSATSIQILYSAQFSYKSVFKVLGP